jgi:hypothetical protein
VTTTNRPGKCEHCSCGFDVEVPAAYTSAFGICWCAYCRQLAPWSWLHKYDGLPTVEAHGHKALRFVPVVGVA